MNEGIATQLASSVQLIVQVVLPGIAFFVMFAMIIRAYIQQESSTERSSGVPVPIAGAGDLTRAFSETDIKSARSLVMQPVQDLLGGVDKFGGHPTGLPRAAWPKCGGCTEPLTFLGQLRAGPRQLVEHPTDGLLQLFICSARGAGRDLAPCDSRDPDRGAARAFFAPGRPEEVILPEDRWEREGLVSAVKRNRTEARGDVKLAGVEKTGRDGRRYYPYLARQYAVVSVELRPSVKLPPRPTAEQLALWSATTTELRVQIGGFPNWIGGEPKRTCTCGAPMECVLQLDPFDEVLTIPLAARLSVLACARRCAEQSYLLMWQAP